MDKDIYDLPPEELKNVPKTPESLAEALDALETDHEFLLRGDVFTRDVIETWLSYKREHDVDAIRLRPHPYEFCQYFDYLGRDSNMIKRVLILCTGSSCRSQIAQVIWQQLGQGEWTADSAGSKPTGCVHPLALQVIQENGSDSAGLYSKSLDCIGRPKIPRMPPVPTRRKWFAFAETVTRFANGSKTFESTSLIAIVPAEQIPKRSSAEPPFQTVS